MCSDQPHTALGTTLDRGTNGIHNPGCAISSYTINTAYGQDHTRNVTL